MSKNITLNIAGFSIVIRLEDPGNYAFSKIKLSHEINQYLKGFIHRQVRRADFTINIQQKIDNDVIYKKKEKSFYFKIFEVKKRQINCNYEISFSQLIFIIRYIILQLLSENNGFLMHGSAVALKDKAYIFTGPSGAGKSTIMKMLNTKYLALADDSVIIKPEKDKYFLYQTPMIEKESWVNKQSKKNQIGGIFFLNKSADFKIETNIKKNKVIARLISQLFVNEDQTKKQVINMADFVKNFSRFGMISFSKDKKKLLEFFSKHIL